MTLLVAMVSNPNDAFPDLPETAPLSAAEAANLYRATFRDALLAAERSGGGLLVNYPEDGETLARSLVAGAEGVEVDETRFEVQVGGSFSARAGNAVTHLLEEEEEASTAILDGRTPLLTHTEIDSAAMRLRRDDAVFAPGPRGTVGFAGFCEPTDFTDAWQSPALPTLARRCADSGHEVGFLPHQPVLQTGDDLATLVGEIEARRAAGRATPHHTTSVVESYGLGLEGDELVRGD